MAANEKTDVPCDGCVECCRSGQALFLHPNHGDDVTSYDVRVAVQPDGGEPVFVLATKASGECVYLGSSGCTIYERRPLLCRTFDCRKHYLILPRQDRENLVRLKLSAKTVFDAGKSRVNTLSGAEQQECRAKREEFFY